METTEKLSDNIFGALTRSEVAEKLAPAIRLHGIEVQNDCFVFPGISPTVGISESQLPGPDAPGVIHFEDIASITPFSARIEVLLFSGELYTFSITDTVRTHINTYKSGATSVPPKHETTAKVIADNIWDGLEKTLSSGKDK